MKAERRKTGDGGASGQGKKDGNTLKAIPTALGMARGNASEPETETAQG
jgi:hypothetical protein